MGLDAGKAELLQVMPGQPPHLFRKERIPGKLPRVVVPVLINIFPGLQQTVRLRYRGAALLPCLATRPH